MIKFIFRSILLFVALSACVSNVAPQKTSPEAVHTSAAGTAFAYMTQTAFVDSLLATNAVANPSPTATLLPVTVTPRPSATPVQSFKEMEYASCGVKFEIPSNFTTIESESKLTVYDPSYKEVPSFAFTIRCRQSYGDSGNERVAEMLVEQELMKTWEGLGYEVINYPDFKTHADYFIIYSCYREPPEMLDYWGVTVVDREWYFNILGVSQNSTITVHFRTDAYVDENLIWHIVYSVDPAE
jgi:hypothetical protein